MLDDFDDAMNSAQVDITTYEDSLRCKDLR
jgi:hypothetical protein